MSKLIILDWIKLFGHMYDFIALGDNDLYFQRDVNELFEDVYCLSKNKIQTMLDYG